MGGGAKSWCFERERKEKRAETEDSEMLGQCDAKQKGDGETERRRRQEEEQMEFQPPPLSLFYSNLYFSSETNVLCLLIVR